jgi:hypothetical protein
MKRIPFLLLAAFVFAVPAFADATKVPVPSATEVTAAYHAVFTDQAAAAPEATLDGVLTDSPSTPIPMACTVIGDCCGSGKRTERCNGVVQCKPGPC